MGHVDPIEGSIFLHRARFRLTRVEVWDGAMSSVGNGVSGESPQLHIDINIVTQTSFRMAVAVREGVRPVTDGMAEMEWSGQ